jgi:hypothetical protein
VRPGLLALAKEYKATARQHAKERRALEKEYKRLWRKGNVDFSTFLGMIQRLDQSYRPRYDEIERSFVSQKHIEKRGGIWYHMPATPESIFRARELFRRACRRWSR